MSIDEGGETRQTQRITSAEDLMAAYTDGRRDFHGAHLNGLPLAVVVARANVHDLNLAAPTLDALVVDRLAPTAEQPQHLCLDAGYDYDLPRFAAEQRHYTAHIRLRGEERANVG